MITRINAQNHAEYVALFDKAKIALKAKANSDPNFASTYNYIAAADFDINTLNDYFANLRLLTDIFDSQDIKSFYRLPLDEQTFDINANSRQITVPSEFARYGVGVQGDESAEIIYFKIDRFFDQTDLAYTNIVIQWEARDKNKQMIYGLTPNFGRDLETEPGKIIFGLPIYGEMTEAAGTIKFAVRFYTVATENNEQILNFSFATLPAEIMINQTLNYELLNNSVPEISHDDRILNRITSVGIYDTFAPRPGTPIILDEIQASDTMNKVVDFVNGSKTLLVRARPVDNGSVFYTWKLWPYNPETGDYKLNSNEVRTLNNSSILWKRYEEATLNRDDEYWIKEDNNVYRRIVVENLFNDGTIDNNGDNSFTTKDGEDISLYQRFSTITVDENNGAGTGIYTVNIQARAANNNNSIEKVMDPTEDGIKIPGPKKPIIESDLSSPDDQIHVILEDEEDSAELVVNAVRGEIGLPETEVGVNPENNVTLEYNWADTQGLIDVNDNDYSLTNDNTTLTITNLTEDNLDRQYYAKVTASRNGIQTTQDSKPYRITRKPIKPELLYKNNVVSENQGVGIDLFDRFRVYNIINITVNKPAQTDKVEYIWVKMNVQNELASDWDGNDEKLQVTIDPNGSLAGLFPTNIEGDPDILIGDLETIDFANNNSAIIEKSLEDFHTQPGIYYCIVINTLNGRRVATTSPFFKINQN